MLVGGVSLRSENGRGDAGLRADRAEPAVGARGGRVAGPAAGAGIETATVAEVQQVKAVGA